jgi:hypothetical protein
MCRLCHHDFNLRPEIDGNRLLEKFFNIIDNAGLACARSWVTRLVRLISIVERFSGYD